MISFSETQILLPPAVTFRQQPGAHAAATNFPLAFLYLKRHLQHRFNSRTGAENDCMHFHSPHRASRLISVDALNGCV
jgi:hypothetical protein